MKNFLAIAFLLLTLASCARTDYNKDAYDLVLVKVVFLDGKVDTLQVSSYHSLVDNELREYPDPYTTIRTKAYGVKYVKEIKNLEEKDKNQ